MKERDVPTQLPVSIGNLNTGNEKSLIHTCCVSGAELFWRTGHAPWEKSVKSILLRWNITFVMNAVMTAYVCAQDTRWLPSAAGRRRLDANARARLEMRVHVYPRVLPLSGGERPCQDQKEDAIMYTATPNVFTANSQMTTTDTQTKDKSSYISTLLSVSRMCACAVDEDLNLCVSVFGIMIEPELLSGAFQWDYTCINLSLDFVNVCVYMNGFLWCFYSLFWMHSNTKASGL